MKLRKPNSKFYRWWNSYSGKRIISAIYSLGASVVIMGAMFKILHLPMGNILLGVGMTVESMIFALGIFDKPYREYDWSKIFNFKNDENEHLNTSSLSAAVSGNMQQTGIFRHQQSDTVTADDFRQAEGVTGNITGQPPITGGVVLPTGTLAEDDVQKLSEGIRNLSTTAENLQKLTNIAIVADGLAKNIESVSEIAANFAGTQQKLNTTAETLAASYQNVNSEIDQVLNSTRGYSGNVESVNKSLAFINSVYEIQLRHIQTQTDNLNQQAESIKKVTDNVNGVASDMDKMREATASAQVESQRYQVATKKLTKQVEDLNMIYGNMLNALS